MKICVANQKGGVGKTTISWNLACGLADKKFKTLAIDNDPQGNLTTYALGNSDDALKSQAIDIHNKLQTPPQQLSEHLYLYGANNNLSSVLEKGFDSIYGLSEGLEFIEGEFDYIIIDCLPGLGNLLLSSLNASDCILIPLKPAPFPLNGLKELLDTFSRAKKRLNPDLDILGIVMNFVDSHKIVMEREIIAQIKEMFDGKVFENHIYKRTRLEESTGAGVPIYQYDPKGDSTKNFREFVNEFIKKTEVYNG